MNFLKRGNKKAQLDISFGMLFSIILIIIFIAFGFYAIKSFMNTQNSLQIKQFTEELQTNIDKIWREVQGRQTVSYSLPKQITFVCFQDDEFENLKFISENVIRGKIIQNIDIQTTLSGEEELCIQNIKGKVSFKIAKDYGETLVKIEK